MEISIFVDESGENGTESKYYLLTLLFHEQVEDIGSVIATYERDIHTKMLPDIPFHASPLMNGHDDYQHLDIQGRKRLFHSFFMMVQHLPIKYHTFIYLKDEVTIGDGLTSRIKRDIVNLLFDNLTYFQKFEKVKIYYDNGQQVVTKALHDAAEYALSADAVMYKEGSPRDYRLAQTADLLCTLELTALKYEAKKSTKTDERFFGAAGNFKKNYLKKIRKKLL